MKGMVIGQVLECGSNIRHIPKMTIHGHTLQGVLQVLVKGN